jgi:hypothetical protein
MAHIQADQSKHPQATQTDTEKLPQIRKISVSSSQLASIVQNDNGTLHIETDYATFRVSVNAVDATDMILSVTDGSQPQYLSVPIGTDTGSGLQSAFIPENHREGFANLPLMVFELTPKNIILPTVVLSPEPPLRPPLRFGLLLRVNDAPLFTAEREDHKEEIPSLLNSRFTVMPLWSNEILMGSILNPNGRPAELGRQGFGAPELPALVEVILLASEMGSNSCKALAGCSLHLARTLKAE